MIFQRRGEVMGRKLGVIKARFRSDTKYGLIMITYDIDLEQFSSLALALSNSQHLYSVSPTLYWREFESRILDLVFKGEVLSAATNSARSRLEPILKRTEREVIEALKANDYTRVKEYILDFLKDSVGELNISLDMDMAVIDLSEAESPVDEEALFGEEEMGEHAAPSGVMINVIPVLAPISGVSLVDIPDGTTVYVRFDPTDELSRPYAESLHAFDEEGKPVQIPAVLTGRRPAARKGEVELFFQITNELFGKAVVPEAAKLKVVSSTAGTPSAPSELAEDRKGGGATLAIILLLLLAGAGFAAWYFLFR